MGCFSLHDQVLREQKGEEIGFQDQGRSGELGSHFPGLPLIKCDLGLCCRRS